MIYILYLILFLLPLLLLFADLPGESEVVLVILGIAVVALIWKDKIKAKLKNKKGNSDNRFKR